MSAFGGSPNVILCMTDDQGWGDTGYNGHPELKTPELDKMAAAGIRFDRFFSAHPMCSPTRASCLTGRSPTRYLCMTWGHDLPLGEVTIAEAVKTAGYTTAHFGKWHVGGIPHAAGGTGRGVRATFDPKPRHPGNQGFDQWWSAGNHYDIGYEYIYHNGERVPPREGDTSDALMDVALEWIGRQAKADKPFLALIWFTSPHGPFEAEEKYAEPYLHHGEKKANYYGELAGVDHAMGRLRRALRDMNIADNTMLWYNSDNGGYGNMQYSTGGLPGAKQVLSEGGTRVPGILEWPARIEKPFITTVPACTLDFYPTLLDLLDIEMPNEAGPIDGMSLLPLIDGEMATRPQPIPLVNGGQLRIVDNEYRFQGGRLLRFDEEQKKDVDVGAEMPEELQRLREWEKQWRASVAKDQEPYKPGLVTRVEGEASGSDPGVSDKDGPERAFDGSLHTKYCVGEPTVWVQIKLADGPKCLDAYGIMSVKSGSSDGDPQDWTLKGSIDGEKWDVIDQRAGESFHSRYLRREFRISKPGDYAYYRLDVTKNHGADLTQFAELSLFERSGK
ncbi:MAG: sulfatase-like hydrolase/transferase [Planctomycetes bacterium]|nr:sulfatase-like hydrolase/transferase [Planctomycetota bacterium]